MFKFSFDPLEHQTRLQDSFTNVIFCSRITALFIPIPIKGILKQMEVTLSVTFAITVLTYTIQTRVILTKMVKVTLAMRIWTTTELSMNRTIA